MHQFIINSRSWRWMFSSMSGRQGSVLEVDTVGWAIAEGVDAIDVEVEVEEALEIEERCLLSSRVNRGRGGY